MKRFDLLRSPLLLLAVGVLLLNDFVLKTALHNWFTGKLSDVAGLAAVTIFCCALWPRHVWRVASAITVLFVFWKSPLSQPAIDIANDFAPWRVGRTVDTSDLLALPVVWWICGRANWLRLLPAGRVWVWPVGGLCLFACGASMLFPSVSSSPWPGAYFRADGAMGADQTIGVSALEHAIDDVAIKYGWQSSCYRPPCPGLTAGRTYQATRRSVFVVYDVQRKGLRFSVSVADPKDIDQIKEEIGRAVTGRLPGWTFGDWTDPPKTPRTLRVRIASRSTEVDRAVAFVDQIFRAEGLDPPAPPPAFSQLSPVRAEPRDVWGSKIYSAGPPVDGPSRSLAIVAGWKVEDDRQQWRLVVSVTAGAPEHVDRQTRIVEALRQLLTREFGADAVY